MIEIAVGAGLATIGAFAFTYSHTLRIARELRRVDKREEEHAREARKCYAEIYAKLATLPRKRWAFIQIPGMDGDMFTPRSNESLKWASPLRDITDGTLIVECHGLRVSAVTIGNLIARVTQFGNVATVRLDELKPDVYVQIHFVETPEE